MAANGGPTHSHGGHSHGGHSHGGMENIRLGFFLNLGFTVIEIIGGFWTNSLAILSDAVHDLGDSFSLALSWYLEHVARRPPSTTFTYGYRRFSLLAALANGLILLTGSIFILAEAVPRLLHPQPTRVHGMLWLAILGVAINGLAALRVRRGRTLNERMVTWHFLEDVLGWVAILILSLAMMIRDVYRLDPIFSIVISLYVLWNVVRNLRATLVVFLQGVPGTHRLAEIEERIVDLPDIQAVHDSHLWSMDGEHLILSCHIVVPRGLPEEQVIDVKCNVKHLATHLGIQHTTVEVEYEHETCELK